MSGFIAPVLLVAAIAWITSSMFMDVFAMAADTIIMVPKISIVVSIVFLQTT